MHDSFKLKFQRKPDFLSHYINLDRFWINLFRKSIKKLKELGNSNRNIILRKYFAIEMLKILD